VLEYFEHGSLYDLLHNETIFIEGNLILPILRDVSQGVRFLHSADPQVIHGDLKAANILVDRNFRAKVADFGLSRTNSTGSTGTPFWMAPELLRREHGNSAASDVFSFGIILYEVYSRRDPYEGEGNAKEILRLVCDQAIKKRPEAPISMPDKVKSLMADCVEDEPDKRPTFEELDKRLQRIDSEGADPNETPKIKTGISLFDIFPRHIAEALRDGRTVEPEHKDCVTIFFSDIAGFTDLSSSLSPRQVADLLGRLYTSFDKLAEKHDIFKVETIGDAYVAVTNLVKDQHDDHAKRIAQFAIDAILAANTTPIDPLDPEKGCVNIRCGFHCGPVVADVVGTSNPRYCLFGDSVNTASRMESNSKLNRILCSASAYELLRVQCPEISVASRGIIPVKGKGTVSMLASAYFFCVIPKWTRRSL
jgi:class 3 adenylate cyclase